MGITVYPHFIQGNRVSRCGPENKQGSQDSSAVTGPLLLPETCAVTQVLAFRHFWILGR